MLIYKFMPLFNIPNGRAQNLNEREYIRTSFEALKVSLRSERAFSSMETHKIDISIKKI